MRQITALSRKVLHRSPAKSVSRLRAWCERTNEEIIKKESRARPIKKVARGELPHSCYLGLFLLSLCINHSFKSGLRPPLAWWLALVAGTCGAAPCRRAGPRPPPVPREVAPNSKVGLQRAL